jgi:hypothetical protein
MRGAASRFAAPSWTERQFLRPAESSNKSVAPGADDHDEALEAGAFSFRHPQQVLAHPALTGSQKRALLASWASDACAEENLPGWRRIPGSGALVLLDDVLEALRALDQVTFH